MVQHSRWLSLAFIVLFFVVLFQPHEKARPAVLSLADEQHSLDDDMVRPQPRPIIGTEKIAPPMPPQRRRNAPNNEAMDEQEAVQMVEMALQEALPNSKRVESRLQARDVGAIIRRGAGGAPPQDTPFMRAHDEVTLILTQSKSGSVVAFYRLREGDLYVLPAIDGNYGLVVDRLSHLTLHHEGQETPLFQTNDHDAATLYF